MSSLRSRLDKLEASRGRPRHCEHCRGLTRIVGRDWRDGEPYSHGPVWCEVCERSIPVITVQDVRDWRNERGRRPA